MALSQHVPVMPAEVLAMLATGPGSRTIDATVGGGGHAERILSASDPDGRLLGLDADGAAIASVQARRTSPIETADELAALVERVAPRRAPGRRRVHPATRVFQALRIAVNEELEALQAGLTAALDLLRPGGRLVVLSYHSLEDRIVKRFFQAERRGCTCPPEAPVCVCGRQPRLRLVTPKGLVPEEAEVIANPRARSARLRAAERLAA